MQEWFLVAREYVRTWMEEVECRVHRFLCRRGWAHPEAYCDWDFDNNAETPYCWCNKVCGPTRPLLPKEPPHDRP